MTSKNGNYLDKIKEKNKKDLRFIQVKADIEMIKRDLPPGTPVDEKRLLDPNDPYPFDDESMKL